MTLVTAPVAVTAMIVTPEVLMVMVLAVWTTLRTTLAPLLLTNPFLERIPRLTKLMLSVSVIALVVTRLKKVAVMLWTCLAMQFQPKSKFVAE